MKINREINNGAITYCSQNNNFHREDGPAIICYDGTLYWYEFGVISNARGPSIIENDGFITFGCSAYMEIAGMLTNISSKGKKVYH